MKFLGDVGVSTSTLRALREADYDAVHLREQDLHRLPDSAILRKALEEGRIVITFDLDFGDLLATVGDACRVLSSSVFTTKPLQTSQEGFLISYL